MAKKNEIIVKDVSIKTMTSLLALQQMRVLEGSSGRKLLK